MTIQRFLHTIDGISTWVGKATAWLVVGLMLVVCAEVVKRYLLNMPTAWIFDATNMLYGTTFMLCGAYTLAQNAHVRGDFLYSSMRPRTQASFDLVLYIIFFLPAVLAFMYSGWKFAEMSVRFREVSIFSPAGIPVFPLKAIIPVTGFFLLLQGIAEIIRCILCIRDGVWPPRLHDVEETESVIMHEQQYQQERGEIPDPSAQPLPGHKGTGA